MSRTAQGLSALAALGVFALASPALAQHHYPRQHAVPPPPVPESLPAPHIGHPEANKNEKPKRLRDKHDGGFTYKHPGFDARVGADGRVTFNDINIRGSFFLVPPFIFFAGTMDITDVVMRWLGQDPYQYAKARFLETTFRERMHMRRGYDANNMRRALNTLPRYLTAVWRQRWPAALRRQVLFELWDECAESGNRLMRDGGATARRMIHRFVAINLPFGSPHGFTVAELNQLNRRRGSRFAFAPYGDQRMLAQRSTASPLVMDAAVMRLASRF